MGGKAAGAGPADETARYDRLAELLPDDDARRGMFRINLLKDPFIGMAAGDHLASRIRVQSDQ